MAAAMRYLVGSNFTKSTIVFWVQESRFSFLCRSATSKYCTASIQESNPVEGQDEDSRTWAERLQDPEELKTLPKWMTSKRYMRKMYARHGTSSGFQPGIMWPTKSELAEIIEEEREYHPTLQEMQANIEAKRKAAEMERLKREKFIAACMARMPALEKKWLEAKTKKKEQQQQQKRKRELLLLEAKEKFGYAVDPRHPKFQQYMEEIEKQERKRKKELKKKGIVV
ncbi:large ribosomal subunit protein mL64-like [Glandiceps talaboti]